MNHFGRDKHNTQRDDRFDGRTRYLQKTDCRRNKRDAVCNSECRNRRYDSFAATHNEKQHQHKQQVVDAAENMLNTQHGIGPGNLTGTCGRPDFKRRRADFKSLDLA